MTFAIIPAPGIDSIGPVRLYGITMAIGILVALLIAHKRYSTRYNGSAAMVDVFLPTVVSGVIGARVYHIFTGYNWDANGFSGVFNIRNGGLSIWGAVIGGALGLYIVSKVKELSFVSLGAAIIPGLLVAQAIGRLGNYFNQELFGRELHTFWALKVDVEYRPSGLLNVATYHPTFLYELLWCLALAGGIVACERKIKGWSEKKTIILYIAGYCLGRIFWEMIRIDDASKIAGVRFNLLVSIALFIASAGWFVFLQRSAQKVHADQNSQ